MWCGEVEVNVFIKEQSRNRKLIAKLKEVKLLILVTYGSSSLYVIADISACWLY